MVDKDFSTFNLSLKSNLIGVVGSGQDIYFWIDNWLEIGPLKDRFKDLFKLVDNKFATISDYLEMGNHVIWDRNWTREPSSGPEMQLLAALMQVLSSVSFSQKKDVWVWKGSESDPLSVAGLWAKIHDFNTQNFSQWPYWNSCVPPKINIFFWRAFMNRIPSKMSLSRRGVVLDNLLCSRCDIREETVNHIMWDCIFAKSVWWSIFNWIKLPFPEQPTTVQEILANAIKTNGSKTWKKLIGVIIQVTAWEIWKAGNEKSLGDMESGK